MIITLKENNFFQPSNFIFNVIYECEKFHLSKRDLVTLARTQGIDGELLR
jgi:hypothetical protein